MRRPSDHDPLRLAAAAMGCRFELVIAAARAPRPAWRAIGEEALACVRSWHDRLSRFDPASWVSWVARQPAGAGVPLDADLAELVRVCLGVWRDSGGAFDAAGGRSKALELEAATLRLGEPGIRLDFGAVAKGFALDQAADLLRSEGITGALLHAGTSTVLAIGAATDGRAWRVAVGDGEGAPVVDLTDAALSVSRSDGVSPQPGHVLDPRTGRPARGAGAVAAIAQSAALADAWSTALLVLGERTDAMDDSITSLLPDHAGGGRGWRVQGPHTPFVTLPRAEVCPS